MMRRRKKKKKKEVGEVFFSDEEPRMGFTSIPRNECKRKLGYTGLLGDISDQGKKTLFQETGFKRD